MSGMLRRVARGLLTETADDFAAAARRGRLRPDAGHEADLRGVMSGEKPATRLDIGEGHPLAMDYETGDLHDRLTAARVHAVDDGMGGMVIGRTPEDVERLQRASNPAEYGRAFGYSEDDIRRFYLERRRGDLPAAYEDFSRDIALSPSNIREEALLGPAPTIRWRPADGPVVRGLPVQGIQPTIVTRHHTRPELGYNWSLEAPTQPGAGLFDGAPALASGRAATLEEAQEATQAALLSYLRGSEPVP